VLVDFEVENFRSYREAKRFSMVASSAKELPQNLIDTDLGLKLVRSAVLYGPNASGKSNLLRAMEYVVRLLEFPVNEEAPSGGALPQFALDRISVKKPSRFRVRFLTEGVLYDYTISVRPQAIEEERLVAYPRGRPQEWFHRKGEEFEFNATHLKGPKKTLWSKILPKVSLLAAASNTGPAQLSPPYRWLKGNLRDRLAHPQWGHSETEIAARLWHEVGALRCWAADFLRHADLGIQQLDFDVTSEESRIPISQHRSDSSLDKHRPYFVHSGEKGLSARFAYGQESHGTQRLFDMLMPLYIVLRDGELAVLDELSASLHPSLVREIIRYFHDPKRNPKGAQLVFATHDSSLLSGRLFRRDQVWFTEKNQRGATDLYSLQDIKGVREDEPFEKSYLRGRYGAIPFFGQLDFPPIIEDPAEADT
jgi:predicted ATPase